MAFYLITVFILGSAVGSFLNVVIDRTIKKEQILALNRSYCDHCRATLKTLDLVPILSFLFLGARCRYCRRPISWQYPIIELVTAILFSVTFWILVSAGTFSFTTAGYYFFLIAIMIVVAAIDFKFSLIPTTLVFAACLLALFYSYFLLSSNLFVEHVFAAFAAGLFFLVIVLATFGRGMGQGDISLAFLIGLVLGVKPTMLAIFLAFLTGGLISVLLIALGRKRFGQTVPFAPFLIFGFFVSLFWGSWLINWYLLMLY